MKEQITSGAIPAIYMKIVIDCGDSILNIRIPFCILLGVVPLEKGEKQHIFKKNGRNWALKNVFLCLVIGAI